METKYLYNMEVPKHIIQTCPKKRNFLRILFLNYWLQWSVTMQIIS